MKERVLELLKQVGFLAILGIGYLILIQTTTLRIPCLFRAYTGFKCPGCGVTRMCVAILHGDWRTAWKENSMLLILLPAILGYCMFQEIGYVVNGERKSVKSDNLFLGTIIGILLLFGICRYLLATGI